MSTVPDRLRDALQDRYRIERELGEGGMAVVFLAHDVKHNRDVAIKVLRPELAALIGAERFLAEIETTAQLQHPHVLPLFDSGEADGFLYYVMPYVEGESLAERLERERQLPVEEAVRIGAEVADALDYAHRQGIVHRDVKPANILLHEGRVLVADFGIALAVREAGGSRLTETGLSLGTPHYMSPEQATADRTVDARSDVYSLGAMVYEMLAGRPPHAGTSMQAVIASVLTKTPPPVDEDRMSIPADLAAVVHRAVERLPADRFQTAAEFRDALRDPPASARPTGGGPGRRKAGPSRAGERWAWLGVTAALVLATAAVMRQGSGGDAPPGPSFRFQVPAPYMNFVLSGTRVAISRDGQTLALVAPGGPRGYPTLLTRDLSTLEPTSLWESTEGASTPEFSPDGRSIFFRRTSGGAAVVHRERRILSASWELEDEVFFGGGHWADDGSVYIASVAGIYRLPESGGQPELVASPSSPEYEVIPTSPYPLPGGRGYLFSALSFSASVSDLWVHDSATGEDRLLLRGAGHPHYLPIGPTGVVVFQTPGGRLDGVRFDVESLEIVGEPRPLVTDVVWEEEAGRAYGVSDNGVLVYDQISSDGVDLVWVDREGLETPVAEGLPRTIVDVAVSPDGGRLAFQAQVEGTADIFVYDLEQGTQTRLTTAGGENWRPGWLPDGERIAFVSDRSGGIRAIYTRPVDGSAPAELLVMRDRLVQEITWRDDGTYVFREGFADTLTQRDLLYRSPGDTTSRPFVVTEFDELAPAFSPDGSWVAYVSTEGGRDDVHVRPFPGPGGRVVVSVDGGAEPAWAPDGRTLYYRSPRDSLVAAELSVEGGAIRVRGSTNLFSTVRYVLDRNERAYDVHPDGERFVFIRQPETTNLVVVTEWFREVREILGIEGG